MGDVTALCTSCALCCNGALFQAVRLDSGEARALKVAGRHLLASAQGPSLPQPCPLLRGSICGAYAERPLGCRRFECDMLRAFRRGELTLNECLARIDRVRRFLVIWVPCQEDEPGIAASASHLLELAGLRELVQAAKERKPSELQRLGDPAG